MKFPLVLRVLTWAHVILALWGCLSVSDSIVSGISDGSLWTGMFTETKGLVYLVFNTACKIFPGLIFLFILISFLGLFFWMHGKFTGLKKVPVDRDNGAFFDSLGFRLMLLYAFLFAGSGVLQTGIYAFASLTGMASDTVVGPLILVLVGPLFGFVLFAFACAVVIAAVVCVILYWVAFEMLYWMHDYALNFQ